MAVNKKVKKKQAQVNGMDLVYWFLSLMLISQYQVEKRDERLQYYHRI